MDNKVKILIGSHGSGKSEWIYNYFKHQVKDANNNFDFNKKMFLVVPEQDTNDKQRTMMNKMDSKGILNIDVVSFDRIAHNIFEILNIEPDKEKIVDDDMKSMILSMIMSKLGSLDDKGSYKLQYYKGMKNNIGFSLKLEQAMSEFLSYNVSDENIDKVIENCNSDIIKAKLSDLKLIYGEFIDILKNKLGLSVIEDKYDMLDKNIYKVDMFDDAIVAFDGFTGFTPVQLRIFRKIVERAKEVYVTIDHRNAKYINYDNLYKDIQDTNADADVFYLSKKFLVDIATIINCNDIKDLIFDYNVDNINYKYKDGKDDLKYLEEHIYEVKRKNISYDIPKVENIECYEAKNIDIEVQNVVQKVFELIKNKDYKYNDIRIIVPSIDDYRDVIMKTFNKYGIPYFIDDSENILHAPLIESIRAAIDVVNYDFSYDSVMRYLSSGLIEKNKSINNFNNFLIKHSIRGKDRYEKGIEKISKTESEEKDINDIMEQYICHLISLSNNMNKKGGHNIKNYVNALINFIAEAKLDDYNISTSMELSNISYNESDVVRIRNVMLACKEVVDKTLKEIIILEKMKNESDNIDDENISIEEFRRLLDVGLASKVIKSIPYSLDQIVVGDVMRSRFDNPKVEFFLGLNQGKIPASSKDITIIDDKIRQLFIEVANKEKDEIFTKLSQTTTETALNQRFYIYLILTNPTDKLILSYTKKNADGESDEESSVLKLVKELYNDSNSAENLAQMIVNENDFNFYNEKDLIAFLSLNMDNLRKDYINKKNNKIIYNFDDETKVNIEKAKNAFDYLRKSDEYKNDLNNILSDISDNYMIDNELNAKLLEINKKDYDISPTDIENYNSCPYQYYISNTLKLKDEEPYSVKPFDLGNAVHKVFEYIFKNDDIIEVINEYKKYKKGYKINDENSTDYKEYIKGLNDKKEKIYEKIDIILGYIYNNDYEKIKNLNKKSFDNTNKYTFASFSEFEDNDEYFGSNKLQYIKDTITKLIKSSAIVLIDIDNDVKIDKKEVFTEEKFVYEIERNYVDKNETNRGNEIATESKINEDKIIKKESLGTIKISGKIDRINLYSGEKENYVEVVDYKSGKKEKELESKDLKNGTNIQLTLYIDNCLNNEKFYKDRLKNHNKPIFAGTYYFWVDELKINNLYFKKEDEIENERNLNLGYNGVGNACENVISNIYYISDENRVMPKGNVKLKSKYKMGTFKLKEELDEDINVLHQKINETVNNIEAGNIESRYDKNNCRYCNLKNLCPKKIRVDDEGKDDD